MSGTTADFVIKRKNETLSAITPSGNDARTWLRTHKAPNAGWVFGRRDDGIAFEKRGSYGKAGALLYGRQSELVLKKSGRSAGEGLLQAASLARPADPSGPADSERAS